METRDRVRTPASPHRPSGFVLGWLLIVCAGCGGRAAARPVSAPEIPEHSRNTAEAEPAVRLDRDDAGAESRPDASAESPSASSAESRAAARWPRGVYHIFEPGQTLYSLARAYQVPLETLMRVNGINDPTAIRDGARLFIPGARRTLRVPPTFSPANKPEARAPGEDDRGENDPREIDASVLGAPGGVSLPAPGLPPGESPPLPGAPGARPPQPGLPRSGSPDLSPHLSPVLAWPLRGRITSRFGRRGRHRHHEGVDIDGVFGEEVQAAASGTVVRAGREGRYGRIVVIDHGGGLSTLYAHASRLLVREGDEVRQGEPIAEVGRSGNARGTHLHFEVHRDGRPVDPLPILTTGTENARQAR